MATVGAPVLVFRSVTKRKKSCESLGKSSPVPAITDRPLTPRQLAQFLQVSPRTIARRVHAGDIPYIKLGTKIRFIPSDVLRHLRSAKKS